MEKLNTTNYNFLKNFRPELFKLANKMEEDLLITPISMLAYSTRFLEYILYDIARLNNYKVNTEIGFVNNIYELIQLNHLEFYLGDLLIKAYVFRNTSIHNTNITKSLKEDKKTAFELNRRLFDIADIYYKSLTNDYEDHLYIEPTLTQTSIEKNNTIIKQDKIKLNSDIRDYNLQKVTRNKLVTANLKYDFEYWMKWGLIDKKNKILTIEDIKI